MSRDDARRYVIAYDIPNDRRRGRLAKTLLAYGDRLQYSVFVAECRPAKLERLKSSVRTIIELQEDSVLICDLGPAHAIDSSRFSYIGQDRPITPRDGLII